MTLAGLKGGLRKSVTTFRSHQPPRRSLQSVPIPNTCNMSLVTFHLKMCYSTTSDRITVLVCQVHQSISHKILSVCCLSRKFVIETFLKSHSGQILKSEHVLVSFLHYNKRNKYGYFLTFKSS